jgi:hypothetical protein
MPNAGEWCARRAVAFLGISMGCQCLPIVWCISSPKIPFRKPVPRPQFAAVISYNPHACYVAPIAFCRFVSFGTVPLLGEAGSKPGLFAEYVAIACTNCNTWLSILSPPTDISCS